MEIFLKKKYIICIIRITFTWNMCGVNRSQKEASGYWLSSASKRYTKIRRDIIQGASKGTVQ